MSDEQTFQLALYHHRSGHFSQAQELYNKILVKNPRDANALHLSGTLLAQMGRSEEGIALMQKAIEVRPNVALFHLNLGEAYGRMGKMAEAIASFGQAIKLDPALAKAHLRLSVALNIVGRFDEAITAAQRAIAIRSDDAEAHFNLAGALYGAGQLDAAIAAYRRTVEIDSNYLDAHLNLAAVLEKSSRFDEAIAAASRAIAFRPDSAEAHNNLGVALEGRGRVDEAIAAYAAATRLNPKIGRVYCNLGHALANKARFDEAIAACSTAVRLEPNFAQAHRNLASALWQKGLLDDALRSCTRAVELAEKLADSHKTLGNILKDMGQIDRAIASYRRAVELDPENSITCSNLLYTLYFDPNCPPAELLALHLQWARRHADPLKYLIRPHENDRQANRRLRIGYVSPDFREHPVGRFLLPLLAHHDHAQFEIFCYDCGQLPDGVTSRFQRHADVWREIRTLSHEQAAAQIRQDRIDILVDLTMHMASNRLLVFARKPAPIQATYLAYAGTTGLDTIDYRITDPHLDPPGSSDQPYAERSIRLEETYWCYEPPLDSPDITPPPAASSGFVTFGCLNNFCKVTTATLQAWLRILAAVPNSRLLLHASPGSHRDRISRSLADCRIDPQRLGFVAKLSIAQYLRQYNNIDIGLDPFPYVGGTTTCDALWMGVPVVTLRGQTAISRGGASILTNIGLPELIAHSPEEYVHLATDLAMDLPRLSHLRSNLREKMRGSPLMDAPRFARNMEAVFRQMWRDFVSAT
ncbi:MAG: tetratricopeptide repeat protein [Tepidisphaeraceae bacterium]|jgi:predicted O-linked N-acetylglucosamine transferase (SPINDLY family)